MDLEKNIEIAFGVYWKNLPVTTELNTGTHLEAFITGAKSQAAKDFWYNEFKHEIEVGIVRKLHSEGKCGYVSTEELTDQEKLDIEYGITPLGRQHRQYLKDNPDKPMSFDDWKYMVENYKGESSNIIHKHIGIIGHVDHGKSIIVGVGPGVHCRQESDIIHVCSRNIGKSLMNSIEKIPFEMGGLGQEHRKGVIAIVPDQATMDYASEITRMIAADTSVQKILVITKEQLESKEIVAILKNRRGGNTIIVGETGVDDRIVASAHNIQSIVPIADIIPEEIIFKQEFLKMHDKAVERSITEETYKESRAWDIKKEKKVSHKRNNKRK